MSDAADSSRRRKSRQPPCAQHQTLDDAVLQAGKLSASTRWWRSACDPQPIAYARHVQSLIWACAATSVWMLHAAATTLARSRKVGVRPLGAGSQCAELLVVVDALQRLLACPKDFEAPGCHTAGAEKALEKGLALPPRQSAASGVTDEQAGTRNVRDRQFLGRTFKHVLQECRPLEKVHTVSARMCCRIADATVQTLASRIVHPIV